MSNYSKLIDRYGRYFLHYIDKVIATLSKTYQKFYIDIMYGILKSKSIILSNITHALNEKILLKKTIERLAKFLNNEIDK